jgi:hypothetical protein
MASPNATQFVPTVSSAIIPTTTTFHVMNKMTLILCLNLIELGSQEASNVDFDATWETLLPKFVAN